MNDKREAYVHSLHESAFVVEFLPWISRNCSRQGVLDVITICSVSLSFTVSSSMVIRRMAIRSTRFLHNRVNKGLRILFAANLERVLQGTLAEDVLTACEDGSGTDGSVGGGGSALSGGPGAGAGTEMGMANPAVHFFRGLRHRNVAAMRHAAQRGLERIHGQSAKVQDSVDASVLKNCAPLAIQGLRTNANDSLSHVLFFHIEALIGGGFHIFLPLVSLYVSFCLMNGKNMCAPSPATERTCVR